MLGMVNKMEVAMMMIYELKTQSWMMIIRVTKMSTTKEHVKTSCLKHTLLVRELGRQSRSLFDHLCTYMCER